MSTKARHLEPMVDAHTLARIIRDAHDESNPITEYLDAADAVLAAVAAPTRS